MTTLSTFDHGRLSLSPHLHRHDPLDAARSVAIVSVTTRHRRPLLVIDPRAGEVVADTLRRFHGDSWRILAWTVLGATADLIMVNVAGRDLRAAVVDVLDGTRAPLRNLGHHDPWGALPFIRPLHPGTDLAATLRYILSGSVRTGLADHWTEWRWWGSGHWPRLDAEFLERHPSHLLWLDALTAEVS